MDQRENQVLEWLPVFHERIQWLYENNVKEYFTVQENGERLTQQINDYTKNNVIAYIGEQELDIVNTKFAEYTPFDWAMYFIEHYGQIDGSHHKTWALDQVARIHKGVKVIIKLAKWSNGLEEYRISLGNETKAYKDWVEEMIRDEDGQIEYDYDCGTPP